MRANPIMPAAKMTQTPVARMIPPIISRDMASILKRCFGGLSGRVEHVQHAEMPLILGIEGREVSGRALCELLDVEALALSRQRHRGSNQHLDPDEAGCNDERRCEHEWLFGHGSVPEVAEAPSGSSDRAAALCSNSVPTMFRLYCSLCCGDGMIFGSTFEGTWPRRATEQGMGPGGL